MQDLKTENILKVVYNHPTTKEEKQKALKEYVDLIWKINDLTKEVKELSIPRVSQQRELLLAYEKSQYETTWCMSEAEATNRINDFLANNCG